MTYRLTILNSSTGLFLIGILIYSLLNYKTLSAGEGWGIVAMFGLAGVGLVAGFADLALQQIVNSPIWINGIGLAIVIGLGIALLLS